MGCGAVKEERPHGRTTGGLRAQDPLKWSHWMPHILHCDFAPPGRMHAVKTDP